MNNAKSKSGNLNALRQLVNDDRVFEVNVTDEIVYKDENGNLIERSFGPITQSEDKEGNFGFNTGEDGWRGVTQTPGDQAQKYNSPDNTVKISINSSLSEEGQAQILSEEAYGHAFLFSKGKEHRHQVKSTSKGFFETNKPLIKRITEAIKETIQNMNDDDEN